MNNVVIAGVGKYIPSKIVTNNMLSQIVETSDEWIVSRTGIKQRHITTNENTSDIASKAALKAIHESVGREHLVLDLSCRKKDGLYYIVTDRWQKFTEHVVNEETLNLLAPYCSEFLIHAVDVEGKASGIEEELASILGAWDGIPITYAGGVGSLDDVEILKRLGNHRLDVTIGSALDIFGGTIPFEKAADIS